MLVKRRLYMKVLMVVMFAVAVVSLLGVSSMAKGEADTANTLKVTPVRTDISINPGDSEIVKVTVTNPAAFEVQVRAIQNDFIAGDEDGTPALILDETEYAPKHSLKRFMKPLENVTIPAGESKTVEVNIAVPADADAGGYFGAIRFAPVSPDDGGQVNLSASVASLILLRANGDVPEKLDLTEFAVQKNGKTGSFFNDSNDLAATVRLENEGGVQLGPIGKVSVTKGDKVVYEVDFNSKEQRDVILPDSARRWNIPLEDVGGFGKYAVNATFTYGSKNQTFEVNSSFWIIPASVIIGAAVLVMLIIGAVVWLVYRKRNAKNKVSFGGRR